MLNGAKTVTRSVTYVTNFTFADMSFYIARIPGGWLPGRTECQDLPLPIRRPP